MQRALGGIVGRMPHPHWFALLTDEEMEALTIPPNFSILAVSTQADCSADEREGAIAALICLGTDAPQPLCADVLRRKGLEPAHTATLEAVAVQEGARGQGLQNHLTRLAEERLVKQGIRAVIATAHPDNLFSVDNLLRAGFRVLDRAELYGGQPRLVLYKDLSGESTRPDTSQG